MAILSDEIKVFIVKALASYDRPTQIAKDVLKEFGVEITRQQVFAYDPDGTETPARRWLDLHAATREAFLADISKIGITHKAVRLRMLDRMIDKALEHNYTLVAAKLLVQVARECGGMYERPATRAEKAAAEAQEAAAAMAAIRAWADQPVAPSPDGWPRPQPHDRDGDTRPEVHPEVHAEAPDAISPETSLEDGAAPSPTEPMLSPAAELDTASPADVGQTADAARDPDIVLPPQASPAPLPGYLPARFHAPWRGAAAGQSGAQAVAPQVAPDSHLNGSAALRSAEDGVRIAEQP